MDNIKNNIVTSLFNNDLKDKYYSDVYGFNNDVNTYRNINHIYAKIFFNFLDTHNLDYYVFAGTSIGYLRNKQNIPWVDDYDIMIFEDEINKFTKEVLPKLIDAGFNCIEPGEFNPNFKNGGYFILSKFGSMCFQCDIFYSKVNEDGIVKNTSKNGWGLYHRKNINIDLIKPKKYLTIDHDLTLPFFNNINEDIKIEYGDIFDTSIFHVKHRSQLTIKEHYNIVYEAFNDIKEKIINNTKLLFENHKYEDNETLDNYDEFIKQFNFGKNSTLNNIEFLKYIKQHNVKTLHILDENFLIFCPDIKFYFEDINIHFYMINNIDTKNIILLNFIDTIFCSHKENIEYIEKYSFLFLQKPTIDNIRVITFGTFDLFHIGHTNILKRAKAYGKLCVGVSSDELNKKKGKTSINSLEKRKNDVEKSSYADCIFNEESLELKNEYVKKYNCNLLIMGDDWKNKFNFCDCACLYLERTPGVSTTLLKSKMKK